MRFVGFIGPSYTLQSLNVDCQRCINLYPEMDEMGTGNESEVASLVSTPGLRLLNTLPTGPIRGAYADTTGQLWIAAGNALYQVASNWTFNSVGTLNTSSGPVSMYDNGLQVAIVDGPSGYYWDIASSTFSQIVDQNFPGADQVRFMDRTFIFNKPNSKQFFLSPLNAIVPFSGLDVGSAEASSDNIVGIEVTQENLYILKGQTVEIFFDSGNSSFPYERIQGAVIETGCVAAFSIAKIQNAVYWLGKDKDGRGIVYRAQGLQPERISTFAIEGEIENLGDLSTARAWTYQQAGHQFYCLNLPGANSTWVFDTTTNLWHERASLSQGVYQRHVAECHAFAYNTNVVGDFSNGNIYALDQSVTSDNGNPIPRRRSAPHLSKDMNRLFHSRFQLDMEMGLGLDGSGQGVDPKVILEWSDDYGNSWSNERWVSAGKIGQRLNRSIWRRLGSARDRVYRVTITDPIKVTMLGAQVDFDEGVA